MIRTFGVSISVEHFFKILLKKKSFLFRFLFYRRNALENFCPSTNCGQKKIKWEINWFKSKKIWKLCKIRLATESGIIFRLYFCSIPCLFSNLENFFDVFFCIYHLQIDGFRKQILNNSTGWLNILMVEHFFNTIRFSIIWKVNIIFQYYLVARWWAENDDDFNILIWM